MSQRINFFKVYPEAYQQLLEMSKLTAGASLTPLEGELLKIRASQLNGCAFCLDMHTKDARKKGETEQRLYTVSAWRDTSFFTEREQALLALTEQVTQISGHVQDAVFAEAVKHFGEKGTAEIIMAVIVINSWNRIAISTGMQPS